MFVESLFMTKTLKLAVLQLVSKKENQINLALDKKSNDLLISTRQELKKELFLQVSLN